MIGREKEISKISSLLESSALFPAILLVGPPKSGKSLLMKEVVNSLKSVKSAQVSCLGAPIRLADVFEQILDQFGIGDTCTNLSDFVTKLNKLEIYNTSKVVIVLTNADRLRSLDPHLLPALMKLNEIVDNLNISVVLVSKLPWSKWRLTNYMAANPPVQVFVKPYSKCQLSQILTKNFEEVDEPKELKDNFVKLILEVFQPICKSWPQFKRAADLLWPEYIKPTKETPKVEPNNQRCVLVVDYICLHRFFPEFLIHIFTNHSIYVAIILKNNFPFNNIQIFNCVWFHEFFEKRKKVYKTSKIPT